MIMPFLINTSVLTLATPARNDLVKARLERDPTAMVQRRVFYSFSYQDLSNTFLMLIGAPFALNLAMKDSSISSPNLPDRLPGLPH